MRSFYTIGHRGAKGLAAENTIEAIKKALECKVDMVELDVRLHKGNLVLSHDEPQQSENPALLSDVLKFTNNKIAINLEIKEHDVLDLLSQSVEEYTGRIVYSSKKFSVLSDIRKLIPGAELAVIESWSGVRAVASAELLDTKRIHIKQNWLWGSFVRSMKHRGYEVYAYTVNNKARATELKEWGIDGIFTDFPDKFSKF